MQKALLSSLLRGGGGKTLATRRFQNNTPKHAFTLAEVLITLGIIGIVAALTMPTLITTVQDKILESQVKKARNRVANGYKLMMAHDEIFKVQNLPFLAQCNEMNNTECVSKAHKENFQVLNDSASGLSPDTMPDEYSITGKPQPSPFKWENVKYMFRTGDGMVFGVVPDENFISFSVIVDVNGKNRPNIAAKDLRKFRFSGEGGQTYDVSEELTFIEECSPSNLSACTTEESCQSLAGYYDGGFYGAFTGMEFIDGACKAKCYSHWMGGNFYCQDYWEGDPFTGNQK